MNLIEETRWSIERAKEAARAVFAIPEAEKISESLDRCLEAYRKNGGEECKPLTWKEVKCLGEGNLVSIEKNEVIETVSGFGISFKDRDYWGMEDIKDGTVKIYAHKPEGSA